MPSIVGIGDPVGSGGTLSDLGAASGPSLGTARDAAEAAAVAADDASDLSVVDGSAGGEAGADGVALGDADREDAPAAVAVGRGGAGAIVARAAGRAVGAGAGCVGGAVGMAVGRGAAGAAGGGVLGGVGCGPVTKAQPSTVPSAGRDPAAPAWLYCH